MIVVVDYHMGNLRSVSKALEHLGASVKVSSSYKDIETADKVVLPGVGAFGDAVVELQKLHLFDALKNFLSRQKPFLGICLGLQLLLDESEESLGTKGLNFFPGKVQRFKSTDIKIPHMGWNNVDIKYDHPVLQTIPGNSFFYFVHSYYAAPKDPALILGETLYGTEAFPAILATGTTIATQFHPEKSQETGLKLLKNFINWKP